jgi:hypothetical protein
VLVGDGRELAFLLGQESLGGAEPALQPVDAVIDPENLEQPIGFGHRHVR